MAPIRAESERCSWMVQGQPFHVEYPSGVVEEICATAVEGLSALRRGGMEVGGVLFGIHRGCHVQVVDFRPASCEHAYGPSFTLSEADLAGLKELLEAARHDSALRGLEPVGWYHSHTRSEIRLTEEDLDLYNRFFPEPWQIAMVVRPAQFGPSRAGFFFREENGIVHSGASYLEFSVRPRRRAAPPAPAARRGSGPAVPGGPDVSRAFNGFGPPETREMPQPETPPPIPAFALVEPRRPRRWLWLLVVLCLALAGAGYGFRSLWLRLPAQALSLRVMDLDGQLIIEWDRASAPVRKARRATFEILDGGHRQVVDMEGNRLREGSITYARRSESVDVYFRVEYPGAAPAQEFIRFLGQPPPARPTLEQAEAIRQRDQLQQQVERMRAELARRDAQIRFYQQRLNRRPQQ